MGVLRDKSKKEASGWDGRGVSHRHLPNQTQLSGVCVTVCTCVCVHACLERGRKRERIMVTQAVWLIQTEENTTRLWLVQHTHTHPRARTHTVTQTLGSSPPSLLAFPPGPPSSEGSQKEGSRAQITPRLILTGFSLYTKAYKNNERGFGRVKRRTQPPLLCAKSVTIPKTQKQRY